ncbi:MAG TPA: hypothetical protein VLA58_05365 [Chitinophagaceae bacterium]|nr:hypothetical protein [Chitinophagaceae bacterium]
MIRTIFFSVLFSMGFATCDSLGDSNVKNIKDLDENMIDLRLYHENLGDAIVKKDQDEALWLETGMDSVLRVVAGKFDEHRKLKKPFSESYEKDLKPFIGKMHTALEENSWQEAREAYTLLTKKCNGCHKDLDVDKEVQNWLFRPR